MTSYEQVLKPQGVLRYHLLNGQGRVSRGNSDAPARPCIRRPVRPCLRRPPRPCGAAGWLATGLGLGAEGGGLVVEREAVWAKEMACGGVAAGALRASM